MQTHRCDSFKDARAERYFDIFRSLEGQITVSFVAPHQISGWHQHRIQTDQWFVAKGRLKIATIDDGGRIEEHELIGPADGEVVTIPPGLWHGWRSYDQEVLLIYYLSRKHDEADEIRATDVEIYQRYGYRL